jgi:ketol-acid reductoisomerase
MRYSVSDTAEWGDYIAGPQIINAETRRVMKELLTKIQNGEMAKKWIEENRIGRPNFMEMRRKEQHLLVEKVGAELRALMPFLRPVKIEVEPSGASASAKP